MEQTVTLEVVTIVAISQSTLVGCLVRRPSNAFVRAKLCHGTVSVSSPYDLRCKEARCRNTVVGVGAAAAGIEAAASENKREGTASVA